MELITQIKDNLRIHTITGIISTGEIMKHLRNFYSSPDYSPAMNSLWDLRDADFSEVKPHEIRTLMEMVKGHWGQNGSARSALLVTKDLDFGLARMYEMLMDGGTAGSVMVFRDHDEAVEWLEEKSK